jgi:hypothetical protein
MIRSICRLISDDGIENVTEADSNDIVAGIFFFILFTFSGVLIASRNVTRKVIVFSPEFGSSISTRSNPYSIPVQSPTK